MAGPTSSRVHRFAPARWPARLVELLGPTGGAARQSLIALVFNSLTSFVAGLTLVGILSTLERLPGLLMLIPPAIGLRGNVFSAMGNRLSTAVHMGTYSLSARRESILVQNLMASFFLTFFMSVALAVLTRIVAVTVGVTDTIGLGDLVTISVLGGLLASIPVALATILLTVGAVRFGWDLDNLVAPTVSTLGDVITIPSLWLAALLVTRVTFPAWVAVVVIGVAILGLIMTLRSSLEQLRVIVIESIPVLSVALVLSTLGGLVLQKQLDLLGALPTILVLAPAFVSSGGALGSILSGRVSTNLHLGSVEPTLVPGPQVRRDVGFLMGLALPVFVLNATGAVLFNRIGGQPPAPGWWWTLAVTMLAGVLTMAIVVAISYAATIGAWRVEVDPDSYGVPVVTSSTDFVGTLVLIFIVVALNL